MADKKRAIKVDTLDRLAEGFQESRGITHKLTTEEMIELAKVPTASGENKLAQYFNRSITEITAEDMAGATKISNYAFDGYESLTSVIIPDSVTSIGDYAFQKCRNLTSVTLPNSITKIPYYAFYRCSKLTNITIPNSVTNIEHYAFCATGLTSITIPNSVTSFGMSVFDSASSLKEAYYEGDISSWLNISFADVSSSPVCHAHGLYIKNTLGEYELLKNLEIPDTITELKSYTLARCESLKSVTIPNSVTKIGIGAFQYCINLPSITIPNSVTSIGNKAFSDCNSLTSITIPNSVTSIGDDSFAFCSKLTNVRIGNGITSIHNDAFRSNPQLTDIYIDKPEGSISGAPWGATNATVHWNTPLPSEEG